MGQNKVNVPQPTFNQLGDIYSRSASGPTPVESEMTPFGQGMVNTSTRATAQQMGDYGNIMGAYSAFRGGLSPTASRPAEVGQAYDTLRGALPGYQEFASTGGYSPQDIQELRARGMSPITAAYGNTMRELDRARTLGGGGANAPNYIAAVSSAQRMLPQQLADATTGVNAKLAEDIRQGKLAGLAGETDIGKTMGGLSAEEASRQDAARRAAEQETLASIGGQTSLYGTTPAMASTFGDQALRQYQLRGGMEQARTGQGLQALGEQVSAYTGGRPNIPWWQSALQIGGDVAPFFF